MFSHIYNLIDKQDSWYPFCLLIYLMKGAECMDYYETLNKWLEFSEVLYPLRDKLADTFEPQYFYDDHWQFRERLYVPDEDTVFLLKLSEKLNDICSFVKSHISVLERKVSLEEDMRANQEQAFEAWKRNLCPKLMKNVPRYSAAESGDWWRSYDEVALFLKSECISHSATKKAIEAWKLSREELRLSA